MEISEIEVGGVYRGGAGVYSRIPLRVVRIGPIKNCGYPIGVEFERVHESKDLRSGGRWSVESFAAWATERIEEPT